MKNIIQNLESLSRLAGRSTDIGEVEAMIEKTRQAVKVAANDPLFEELDFELSTWQSKLSVILKEPMGRQGMSKHCLHWVEKLKKNG